MILERTITGSILTAGSDGAQASWTTPHDPAAADDLGLRPLFSAVLQRTLGAEAAATGPGQIVFPADATQDPALSEAEGEDGATQAETVCGDPAGGSIAAARPPPQAWPWILGFAAERGEKPPLPDPVVDPDLAPPTVGPGIDPAPAAAFGDSGPAAQRAAEPTPSHSPTVLTGPASLSLPVGSASSVSASGKAAGDVGDGLGEGQIGPRDENGSGPAGAKATAGDEVRGGPIVAQRSAMVAPRAAIAPISATVSKSPSAHGEVSDADLGTGLGTGLSTGAVPATAETGQESGITDAGASAASAGAGAARAVATDRGGSVSDAGAAPPAADDPVTQSVLAVSTAPARPDGPVATPTDTARAADGPAVSGTRTAVVAGLASVGASAPKERLAQDGGPQHRPDRAGSSAEAALSGSVSLLHADRRREAPPSDPAQGLRASLAAEADTVPSETAPKSASATPMPAAPHLTAAAADPVPAGLSILPGLSAAGAAGFSLPGHSSAATAARLPVLPPARQVAPILIALVQGGESAPDRLTLLLEPEELGRIEIALDRDPERRVMIAVVAERAETLHLLQRDASLLDRALAQAGVGAEGRSLAFDLGSPSRNDREKQAGGRRQGSGGDSGPGSAPLATPPLSLLDIAI